MNKVHPQLFLAAGLEAGDGPGPGSGTGGEQGPPERATGNGGRHLTPTTVLGRERKDMRQPNENEAGPDTRKMTARAVTGGEMTTSTTGRVKRRATALGWGC